MALLGRLNQIVITDLQWYRELTTENVAKKDSERGNFVRDRKRQSETI